MLVVARSESAIGKQASMRGWPAAGDGYWSSESRKTFQHGIDVEELRHTGACAGLMLATGCPVLPRLADASALVLRHRVKGR